MWKHFMKYLSISDYHAMTNWQMATPSILKVQRHSKSFNTNIFGFSFFPPTEIMISKNLKWKISKKNNQTKHYFDQTFDTDFLYQNVLIKAVSVYCIFIKIRLTLIFNIYIWFQEVQHLPTWGSSASVSMYSPGKHQHIHMHFQIWSSLVPASHWL